VSDLPQRENREMKVLYQPGAPTTEETWFLPFANLYRQYTHWLMMSMIAEAMHIFDRCSSCGVPPIACEYGFYHVFRFPSPGLNEKARPDIYEWLCLDCAYEHAEANYPEIIREVGEPPQSVFRTTEAA
jgi:hypothetical protein